MHKFTIRLREGTLRNIDRAAKRAGVKRGAIIRRRLEEVFDGTPQNPLGVMASPAFYNDLCEAMGVIFIQGENLTALDKRIAKKKGQEIRGLLEVDHEYWW